MGDGKKIPLKHDLGPTACLELWVDAIASDAGLPACGELDDARGLSDSPADYLPNTSRITVTKGRLQRDHSRLSGEKDNHLAEVMATRDVFRKMLRRQGVFPWRFDNARWL